jgi:hypothetical protein
VTGASWSLPELLKAGLFDERDHIVKSGALAAVSSCCVALEPLSVSAELENQPDNIPLAIISLRLRLDARREPASIARQSSPKARSVGPRVYRPEGPDSANI